MFSNKNNLSNKEISIIMNERNNIIKIIEEFSKKLPKFSDGRINYADSNKAPVITVVVKYKDKILLLKRSDNVSTYKGKWQVVAGYLDEIKPIKEKVLEELREEIKVEENIIDKILISGFLSAIFSFSKSIDGEGIQEINIKNHIIYYKTQKSIIIVIIADSSENPKQIEEVITRILQQFLLRYDVDFNNCLLSAAFFQDYSAYINIVLGNIYDLIDSIKNDAEKIGINKILLK